MESFPPAWKLISSQIVAYLKSSVGETIPVQITTSADSTSQYLFYESSSQNLMYSNHIPVLPGNIEFNKTAFFNMEIISINTSSNSEDTFTVIFNTPAVEGYALTMLESGLKFTTINETGGTKEFLLTYPSQSDSCTITCDLASTSWTLVKSARRDEIVAVQQQPTTEDYFYIVSQFSTSEL